MVIEIEQPDRHSLGPLFATCRYDRVLIDSVLEGRFGSAHADSAGAPAVARLDSGAFTMLAGDPAATAARELIHLAPISYVTPQTNEWRRLLEEEFAGRIAALPFTDFSPAGLDPARLAHLVQQLDSTLALRRIDDALAERLPAALENDYFFENYWSIDDFLKRGIGYCVLRQDGIVSAATAMAASRTSIDIEIETAPAYRRRGLGTAVAGRLVLYCLEHGIEPRWLAANAASEALAQKLGYSRGETYVTFEIQ